jgi:hypothetical protein
MDAMQDQLAINLLAAGRDSPAVNSCLQLDADNNGVAVGGHCSMQQPVMQTSDARNSCLQQLEL